ncbi:MAG: YkoF family thiamine/hydroxymethylpyrimidine-binding protein [Nitrospirota bacterium]
MIISAQVSLYPLRQDHLSPAIQSLYSAFQSAGLSPDIGTMSTLVTGEADLVFDSLRRGFSRAAANGQVVMVVTLSNACAV